ncbi:MAG: GLUG motif-containing protein [Bacillota bacterium]
MKNRTFAFILAAAMALSILPAISLAVSDTAWYTGGGHAGDLADPYLIASGDELAGLAELINSGNDFAGKVVKVADGATVDISAYPNWTPIGTPAHPFRGTFDGNGISIDHLTIDDTYVFTAAGARCVGLFGDIGAGGAVKNIVLNAPEITVNHTSGGYSNTYSYVGGIAGVNEGTVSGCTVTNAVLYVSGIDVKVGGVVGTNSSDSGTSADVGGVMQDCTASVDIDAVSGYQMVQAGGVAGSSTKPAAQITGCSSAGSVTAMGSLPIGNYICAADVGGLVGYIDSTEIMGCASSCEVTAEVGFNNVNAGGLIGTIVQSNVSDSSSTGNISGKGGESPTFYGMVLAGGFTGSFSNGSQISDCYSTGDASA